MRIIPTNEPGGDDPLRDIDQIGHVIGSRHDDLCLLPDLDAPAFHMARRALSELEKASLIDERGQASNKAKLDLQGTHYEKYDPSEIAMMILPLKGL